MSLVKTELDTMRTWTPLSARCIACRKITLLPPEISPVVTMKATLSVFISELIEKVFEPAILRTYFQRG